MMATQYAIDEALAILHRWLDAGGPRAKSNAENDALRDAVEIALGAYRELRQRDANVTTILIEAIARGVELRKVGADGTAPEPHNDRVEGRDAASSRRVPSHDGLCGAVDSENGT